MLHMFCNINKTTHEVSIKEEQEEDNMEDNALLSLLSLFSLHVHSYDEMLQENCWLWGVHHRTPFNAPYVLQYQYIHSWSLH